MMTKKISNRFYFEDKIKSVLDLLEDLETVLKSQNISKDYGLVLLEKIKGILIIPKKEEY